ncbi:alpha/beta fold hydrolase [Gordonia liuliyuniae]|uniref:Alpha/beta hydrolase n=1 Tax=Gordonia liuliyuniae TaxID=2911517 RepID=A0ABS9IPW4_9ACTN|nr:alpha/beta fold hydrolase [Gordonia liuliyuniae]MCF8587601.1 alpha/beta hydrolase [Gordonia liuliyuniae]
MTELHVIDEGAGPAVVLLHGIGGSSRTFGPQFAELTQDMRLIAWDAPGYGESADVDERLTMDDYADQLAALIEARCGDGGAHVLGMSWGGVIATRLAIRRPDLVRSLILGSSTVGSGANPAAAAAMRSRADDVARDIGAFVEDRARRLLPATADDDAVTEVAREMAAVIRPAGYRSAAEAMAATDHTADLTGIDIPTLVISGDCDEVTGHAASQALAGGIPGAVYVTLRGAGHLANRDCSDAFNAWTGSFIQIAERLRSQ